MRAAIAQRREAKRRVKRVLLSATATEEPPTSTSSFTSTPAPAATAAADRLQSMEPLKEKPRLISAAIDPKVFPDSDDDDDDDDDDPIALPATVRTPGEEDLPFESSCSTLDSPPATFAAHSSSPTSSSPPNSPSALEASIGTDWRAGLASAENDDDDDDDEVVEKPVEKVQTESKSSRGSDREVQSVTTVNSTAEGETEIEEDDDDATQCAADIDCSPKQAHFAATAKPTSNTNGLANIEVKCSAMTIQERMRSADAAAAATRTALGTAQSEPCTSSSSAAATATTAASRESRELWMGPLSPKASPSPIIAASSPPPARVATSVPSLRPTGGGVTAKDQGADRGRDRDGDGGEDLGEIVSRTTPEKPCKVDYSSGSQSSEKQRLNQSTPKTGTQSKTTHSSSSSSSSNSTGHNRHQHHTTKLTSLNNINAIDSKTARHSQGPQKGRYLADALTTKKTAICKPTSDTFYGKKS